MKNIADDVAGLKSKMSALFGVEFPNPSERDYQIVFTAMSETLTFLLSDKLVKYQNADDLIETLLSIRAETKKKNKAEYVWFQGQRVKDLVSRIWQ
jgi:hypothetical protein